MTYKLDSTYLREPTVPFDFQKNNASEVFENLKEALLRMGGYGLAANQVGLNFSAFVFGNPEDPSTIECLFNPRIVNESIERKTEMEGCLSFPKLFLPVERSFEIRVRFDDLKGKTKTATFNGMTARIISHEVEHLNGKTFGSSISKFKLRRAIEKNNKKYGTNFRIGDLQTL